MKFTFETLAGQQVRVCAPVIHLVNEGADYEDMEENPIDSRYKVIVGDEYFVYPISGATFTRLTREFDEQEA